ncbi:hypothetical protein ACIOG9_34565, partial [Streptomyces sp. NPDC088178]
MGGLAPPGRWHCPAARDHLTTFHDDAQVTQALRDSAQDDPHPDDLLRAVRDARSDCAALGPAVARPLLDARGSRPRVSPEEQCRPDEPIPRESDVPRLLALCLTNARRPVPPRPAVSE